MIRTSFDGTSPTFSTVRGLNLVCSFLICLIWLVIDVGRLAEFATNREPDAVFPWFGIWGCWAGAGRGIGACGCGVLEDAAVCFTYTVSVTDSKFRRLLLPSHFLTMLPHHSRHFIVFLGLHVFRHQYCHLSAKNKHTLSFAKSLSNRSAISC